MFQLLFSAGTYCKLLKILLVYTLVYLGVKYPCAKKAIKTAYLLISQLLLSDNFSFFGYHKLSYIVSLHYSLQIYSPYGLPKAKRQHLAIFTLCGGHTCSRKQFSYHTCFVTRIRMTLKSLHKNQMSYKIYVFNKQMKYTELHMQGFDMLESLTLSLFTETVESVKV